MPTDDESENPNSGYWYQDVHPNAVTLLHAIRTFRAADEAMRNRLQARMHMNETDLMAVRYLAANERTNTPVSPKDLSKYLKISSASTTKMLDRLSTSGHIVRHPHPLDRRALTIRLTPKTHEEVRSTLTNMHENMRTVVDQFSPPEQRTITDFLQRITQVVSQTELPEIPAHTTMTSD